MAGNPVNDVKASNERFKNGVKPVLANKGFIQLNKRSHTMVNHEAKTVILCMSAPSDTKYPGQKRDTIRKLRKQFGKDYVFYLHFNRPKQEWINKPVYQSILKQFVSFKSLTGVVIGIEELVVVLPDIDNKEIFYKV